MSEKVIARIDMIGFEGEITEKIYFKNKDSLIEEIEENINVGRPYNLTIYEKDLIINIADFYW